MKKISPEELISCLDWRYATKKFDGHKKIDKKVWAAIEQALVLTPSSFGLQPWKFIIVENQDLKNKLKNISWNQSQVSDCSHLVVITARVDTDADYISHYVKRIAQVRGVDLASLDGYKKMMIGALRNPQRNNFQWADEQAHIALGNLMTVAALLGVDACPLGGIEAEKYDEALGLKGSAYKTVVACALGYRAVDDKYAEAKKVRFSIEEMVEYRS